MTEAQERIYAALVKLGSDGWPVSVREVQRECGYASTSMVHGHLHALRDLGLARQHPRNVLGGWKAMNPPGTPLS